MLRVQSRSGEDPEIEPATSILEELEEILGRPVLVKSDPLLHHEKFDLDVVTALPMLN